MYRPIDPLTFRMQYGQVRPIISVDNLGKRFVAVGSTVYFSDKWRTFPDFLCDYIQGVFGKTFGDRELAKPLLQRHPILQWHFSMCEYQRERGRNEQGLIPAPGTGPGMAYMLLAYHLYVLKHHMVLQKWLVERLKDPEHFQGALYELYTAATFICAGFDVRHEDEADGSRSHPEFVAVHRLTKAEFDVEAKSKHRPGVLGFRGKARHEDHVGIRRLLRDAIRKYRGRPFIVFIDLNMAPATAEDMQKEQGQILRLFNRANWIKLNGSDLFNLVVCTNFPYHRTRNLPSPCPSHWFGVYSERPATALSDVELVQNVILAVEQHGAIPSDFPRQ